MSKPGTTHYNALERLREAQDKITALAAENANLREKIAELRKQRDSLYETCCEVPYAERFSEDRIAAEAAKEADA